MITGACNCGTVSFQASVEPTDLFVCHCSICRRATGSNGIAVIVVANEEFQWNSGASEISHWKKPDADWEMWFCRNCGSPLPGHNDAARMFIPAGTISRGGEALKVTHHICVDSKAGWDEIGDDGHQHGEAFSD